MYTNKKVFDIDLSSMCEKIAAETVMGFYLTACEGNDNYCTRDRCLCKILLKPM